MRVLGLTRPRCHHERMDTEIIIDALHEADILLGSLTSASPRFEDERERLQELVSGASAEARGEATAEDRAKLEGALHASSKHYRHLDRGRTQ